MEEKNKFLDEYQKFCQWSALPPGEVIDKEKEIMWWGLGVAGEAGDIAGCIKKTVGHKNDQTAGIKENLGDTLWYIAMICNFYGWDLQEVIEGNIEKVKKRYPNGFDYKIAQRGGTRTDWNEK
ncbi:MAG: nucleoside triphosphate pyrophosphohydrolase family protein [bacterium]|nr:nucleoside triphosphate pyrophosphohydrolase family protein [bacterium]